IGYDKKCKLCGKSLTNDEIVKGYQFEKDQFIVVESEDLEKVKLKTTRVVEIEGFVDRNEIPPTLYDSAYFAGPDGDVSVKTFAILRAALEESGKVGLGKVVLRDREDMVAIAPYRDGIIMYKLHYPKEVRNIDEVPQIGQQQVDENALKLAHNLIDTMTTSIDKIEMKDRYSDSLRELFDAKIQGREVVSVVEKEQPTVDIMAALKESIEQAKAQRKPMVKATGAKKEAEEEAVAKETAAKTRKRKTG
ncbi:MAG TPA: Ku protein, partial [Blastocatellia bacterium]